MTSELVVVLVNASVHNGVSLTRFLTAAGVQRSEFSC